MEKWKLQKKKIHCGIDKHGLFFYQLFFQHCIVSKSYHYALPHLPHAEGCAYHMTRFDAYNVCVLIIAKKGL